MYCTNCGSQIPDDSAFCTNCGAAVGQTTTQPVEETTKVEEPAKENPVNEMAGKAGEMANKAGELLKKVDFKDKKTLGIIGAVVALVLALCFFMFKTPTVDMNDYITVKCEGYNGYGVASYEINYEKLAADHGKHFRKGIEKYAKKNAAGEYYSAFSSLSSQFTTDAEMNKYFAEHFVSSCTSAKSLDKTSHLQNGDEVNFTYEINPQVAKELFGVNLKGEAIKQKVSGLKEIGKFDPFKYVTFNCYGEDGSGRASVVVDRSQPIMENVYFDIQNSRNLKNGDKVEVTLSMSDYAVQNTIQKYGKAPSKTKKVYTVDTLGRYVTSSSEISKEYLTEIKEHGEKYIKNTVLSNLDEGTEKLKKIEYVGSQVCIPTTPYTYQRNRVYLVYKITVNQKYLDYNEDVTYYWTGYVANVTINDKKVNCCDLSDFSSVTYNRITFNSGLGKSWYYNGYSTIEEVNARIQQLSPAERNTVTKSY